MTRTPASGPRSGRSFPKPPGSAAGPRFARTITTRAGPGPTSSPRAPSSRPSSPSPAGRPWRPSTSTSSTLRGTPSLQNRPDAEGRRAGPDWSARCFRTGVCGGGRSPVGRAVSGPVGAVLHIRSGPATGGSAESCGNIPELNAGEILPCAERVPLHMGEHRRKTSDSREPRNHAENPGSVRGGAALRCAIPRDQRYTPTGPRPGRRRHRRPRSASGTSCAWEGAMAGGDPRIVRNGALGGSFAPAPGDRLDGTAESCGCRRGCPACGGERSSRSARTGAGGGAGPTAIDSAGRLGATLPP